jgi:hypothetical protein
MAGASHTGYTVLWVNATVIALEHHCNMQEYCRSFRCKSRLIDWCQWAGNQETMNLVDHGQLCKIVRAAPVAARAGANFHHQQVLGSHLATS